MDINKSYMRDESDDRLNYHHLRYFWLVVREGSVVAAARQLGVSQPAVSGQVGQLEKALGQRLFRRQGRRLQLTERGALVYEYAQRIFSLGQEMVRAAIPKEEAKSARISIGSYDAVPSATVEHVLRPYLESSPHVVAHVYIKDRADLLEGLANGTLDMIITENPVAVPGSDSALSYEVFGSEIAWFAVPALARRIKRGFPQSLNGTVVVLPTRDRIMRRVVDAWLHTHSLRPIVRGEIEDRDVLLRIATHLPAVCPDFCVFDEMLSAEHAGLETAGRVGVQVPLYASVLARSAKDPEVAKLLEMARRWKWSGKRQQ